MKRCLVWMLLVVMLLGSAAAYADSYTDMLARAIEFTNMGELEKAIASYQLAQKMQPDVMDAYLGEAELRIRREEYDAARQVLDDAIAHDPYSKRVWKLKCQADVAQGNVEAFESDLGEALINGADFSDDYMSIGLMYYKANDFEKASSYFLLVDPDDFNPALLDQAASVEAASDRDDGQTTEHEDEPFRNEALDNAYASGNLTLMPVQMPAVTADCFEFPDEMWDALGQKKPEDPYAFAAAMIRNATTEWISLSPTGESGLLDASGLPGLCYYQGKFRVLYPSLSRGVPDVNGNLALYASQGMRKFLGKDGVVYSPDGRYAMVFNYEMAIQNGQFYNDPIILDLSTGEIILTATYLNDYTEDNMGAVVSACFSNDGRYLYYILYGRNGKDRFFLYRYHLETSETELCRAVEESYFPLLSEISEGQLMAPGEAEKQSDGEKVLIFEQYNETWKSSKKEYKIDAGFWRTRRLFYSPLSGKAVAVGGFFGGLGIGNTFQVLNPKDQFTGMDTYYMIPAEEKQLKIFNSGNYKEVYKTEDGAYYDYSNPPQGKIPYQEILAAALSPDGNYLFLITTMNRTNHLYLVGLDDCSMKEIQGIDPQIIPLIPAFNRNYGTIVEWNCDTMFINTSDGVKSFRFKYQKDAQDGPTETASLSPEQLETEQFRISALSGDTAAQYELAWRYQFGIGIEQDYQEAMKWYREAAVKEYAAAQSQIGWMYQQGLGVEQNYAEALKWYIKAAEQGNAPAQNQMGWMYQYGLGVEQNYAEAYRWYLKAAENGNDSAQVNLAYLLNYGLGTEKNEAEGIKWNLAAAEQGNDVAQNNVGCAYEYGSGIEQDYAEAFKWFSLSADQGNSDAQNNIGFLYLKGWGVEQDYQEAFNWFMKSAEQGNITAMSNVSWCYENGNGVEKNPEEAKRWLDLSEAGLE